MDVIFEKVGTFIQNLAPVLNWFATNTWIWDILILISILFVFLAGFLRGFWKSVLHLGVTTLLLVLSYLVFAPLLANFILDDLLILLDQTLTINAGEIVIECSTIRDVFVLIGTSPTSTQALAAEFCSDIAYNVVLAVSMIMMCIMIYSLSWLISTILGIPLTIFLKRKKRKMIAAGKKYKRHRLLGGAVSLVTVIVFYFFALNAGYVISSLFIAVRSVVDFGDIVSRFLPIGDLANALLDCVPTVGGEHGIISSFLAFDGFMYKVHFEPFADAAGLAIPLEKPRLFGEAIVDYFVVVGEFLNSILDALIGGCETPVSPLIQGLGNNSFSLVASR